jgi:hypothetical protein
MTLRLVFRSALFVFFLFCLTQNAAAQCSVGPSASCVTSVTVSPSTLPGDGSLLATVNVGVHIAGTSPMVFYLALSENDFGSSNIFCPTGQTFSFSYGSGCTYPNVGPGDLTLTFYTNATNSGTTAANATLTWRITMITIPG